MRLKLFFTISTVVFSLAWGQETGKTNEEAFVEEVEGVVSNMVNTTYEMEGILEGVSNTKEDVASIDSYYTKALEAFVDGDMETLILMRDKMNAINNEDKRSIKVGVLVKRLEKEVEASGTKKDTSGMVLYFAGNIADYMAGAGSLPNIFTGDGMPVSYASVFVDTPNSIAGILGLSGGLAFSIASTYKEGFPIGRAMAIEFFTRSIWYNVFSTLWSFDWYEESGTITYNPDGSADYSDYSYSDYTYIQGFIEGLSLLTARTLSIVLSKGKTPVKERYGFMYANYMWGVFYSWMVIAEWDEVLFNEHFSFIATALVGDAAAVGSAFLYEKLNWSSARIGLMNVGGLTGLALGGLSLIPISDAAPAFTKHSPIYLVGWSAVGLVLGAFLTRKMPTASEDSSSQFLVTPFYGKENAGLAFSYERRF